MANRQRIVARSDRAARNASHALRRPRMLGIKVAGDFSSEASVFASLLRHGAGRFDAHVIYHRPSSPRGLPANDDGLEFARAAAVPVSFLPLGWTASRGAGKSRLEKVVAMVRLARGLPRALLVARRFNPDVVYSSQQRWDLLVATIIAKLLRKPQIVHLHYNVGPWLGALTLRRLRDAEHVVTVSRFIEGQLDSRTGPTTTILNAIDVGPSCRDQQVRDATRAELGIPVDARVVGMVGRLDPLKGQQDLLSAFAALPAAGNSYLVLAGSGPFEAELRALAQALGIEGRVRMPGFRRDVEAILSALDVFAHPSLQDPCPLAVLEASAAGLPILAYRDGGAPEVVVDRETGFLVEPGDVDGLGRELAALLDDPALSQRMGNTGRQRMAEHFRPERAGRDFADVIESVSGLWSTAADRSLGLIEAQIANREP